MPAAVPVQGHILEQGQTHQPPVGVMLWGRGPPSRWGGWQSGWLLGVGVMQGSKRGGQGGMAPSPARCAPRPVGALTFSCPQWAAGSRGSAQHSLLAAGYGSAALGASEAINLVPE